MKTFKYLVNGLEVEAKYDEEDIDKRHLMISAF